ncbi:transketolase-like [Sycon ciliatum]|uniref:transketolase-like n=1 Tax=Sycon ciliatum TaxID=27933 RepID=UPI0031F6A5D3
MADIQTLKDIANRLRIYSIESTTAAKSGHPTSCMSAADIMAVLFHHEMRYDVSIPRGANNDRFILSKGHAAPILYAAWHVAGHPGVTHDDLLQLRKMGHILEGHPTPRIDFVDVATGSLGQGLSVAAGMAYTGKYFDKSDYRVYCMMGDGESAEGSVWEAAAFAGHYKLNNLVGIIDVNRLGQSDPAALQHDTEAYKMRLQSFGWNAIVVDGHDIAALVEAFKQGRDCTDKPTALIAKTFKGYAHDNAAAGISDELNWHGKPLGDRGAEIIAKIKENTNMEAFIAPAKPTSTLSENEDAEIKLSAPPAYGADEKVATRVAYGTALKKLGQSSNRIVAMDGDTKNSTFAITFQKEFPDRFIECFIAEQNLVGVATGCGCRKRTIPFASTFAAFFSRAYDQIRMGAISQANIKLVGSHAGVSIGEDGPSQMALEDLAMFRSIPTATVFYPSDPVSMERAVELAANTEGIVFIRSSRPALPLIYTDMNETFAVGKSKVVKSTESDKALLIGAGVTLAEAVKAHDTLAAEGINVRVLDVFCVKPIDKELIISSARAAGNRIITVEDHYREGGIGSAVAEAVCEEAGITLQILGVSRVPSSGPAAVLIDEHGISAAKIIAAVKKSMA